MSPGDSERVTCFSKEIVSTRILGFLTIYGIFGLAIAFVIGQAASKLITAFVNDIITPFDCLPAGDLSKMAVTVGQSNFMWGDLIANIIDFIIIVFIIFLAYKRLSRLKLVEVKTKPNQNRVKSIKRLPRYKIISHFPKNHVQLFGSKEFTLIQYSNSTKVSVSFEL